MGLVVVTVVPASERPVTGVQHDYEHFIAFGFVGFIFALAYSGRPFVLFPSAILFTAALELMQIPLPTRHARLGDFLTDALAACIGIGLAHLSARAIVRRSWISTPNPCDLFLRLPKKTPRKV
jgi:VanZ family protein